MPTSPSRRAVLAALAASGTAAVTGCATPWGQLRVQPLDGDPPPPEPAPDPDELARRRAVDGVRSALTALGPQALTDTTGPTSAPRAATPVRLALQEQLTELGETASPSASSSSSASPSSSASASASPTPSSSGGAADVAALLRRTAASARDDLAGIASGTARLLACVAAGDELAADWLAGPAEASPTATSSPTIATSSPTTRATAPAATGEQSALVTALAVQEQARYGYGVLAVRLADAQRDAAVTGLAAHGLAVERLRERLFAVGAAPPQAQPAWALPTPVTDAAGAVALAVQLESASTAAAADLVAASPRERRTLVALDLSDAARRWQWWREQSGAQDLVALPGLTGR